MADPASIEAQQKAEAAIDAASSALELSVLAIIAEKLAKIGDMNIADVYSGMPEDIQRIRQALGNGIEGLERVTDKVMADMARGNDEWASKYYEARKVEQRSAFTHSVMQNTLKSNTESAKRKASALCRSSIVAVGDNVFVPLEEGYRRIVSTAATAMTTGSMTIEQATAAAVRKMASNGLRVMYESGVTRNLQSAVRTNVMDAYRSTMSSLRETQGAEFGADGVEVSAHALCAPDHQPYQGQQYSYERVRGYERWSDVQTEPPRPLVIGANCHHTVFPVILGISKPAYSREELRELNARSNETVEFEGLSGDTLTMSRYEASQYQRKMETSIRKHKELAYLQEKAGNDASLARERAKALTRDYKGISDQMGLRPRLDLTRIYAPK